MKNQKGIFDQGIKILKPILEKHGFQFHQGISGKGSGGHFIRGNFKKGNRKLELHLRFTLGLVTYHFGEISIAHKDYMKAIEVDNEYPGFSDNPLDGFKHLASDLENFCEAFLKGDQDRFKDIAEKVKQNNKKSGFKALS